MLTLSACLCVIILAFINAIFGQPTADYVKEGDKSLHLKPFFKSEGFYSILSDQPQLCWNFYRLF